MEYTFVSIFYTKRDNSEYPSPLPRQICFYLLSAEPLEKCCKQSVKQHFFSGSSARIFAHLCEYPCTCRRNAFVGWQTRQWILLSKSSDFCRRRAGSCAVDTIYSVLKICVNSSLPSLPLQIRIILLPNTFQLLNISQNLL